MVGEANISVSCHRRNLIRWSSKPGSFLKHAKRPIIITGLRAVEDAQGRRETLSISLFFLRHAEGARFGAQHLEPCFRWVRRRGP